MADFTVDIDKWKIVSPNHIYNMDCMDFLKLLPDKSVDLVIADPPYFRMRGDFDFVFSSESAYLDWTLEWVREIHRVLKETGAFYCWGSSLMIDKTSAHVLDKFCWERRNLIVWNFRTGRPSQKSFRIETDFLWFYAKHDHSIHVDDVRIPYANGYSHEKDKRKNPRGKSLGNVWEAPRIMPNYAEWVDHPTQKPLSICSNIIKASSSMGDLVYIPFAGSGSETLCCKLLGRNFIASEINTDYCKLIKRRLAEGH